MPAKVLWQCGAVWCSVVQSGAHRMHDGAWQCGVMTKNDMPVKDWLAAFTCPFMLVGSPTAFFEPGISSSPIFFA